MVKDFLYSVLIHYDYSREYIWWNLWYAIDNNNTSMNTLCELCCTSLTSKLWYLNELVAEFHESDCMLFQEKKCKYYFFLTNLWCYMCCDVDVPGICYQPPKTISNFFVCSYKSTCILCSSVYRYVSNTRNFTYKIAHLHIFDDFLSIYILILDWDVVSKKEYWNEAKE